MTRKPVLPISTPGTRADRNALAASGRSNPFDHSLHGEDEYHPYCRDCRLRVLAVWDAYTAEMDALQARFDAGEPLGKQRPVIIDFGIFALWAVGALALLGAVGLGPLTAAVSLMGAAFAAPASIIPIPADAAGLAAILIVGASGFAVLAYTFEAPVERPGSGAKLRRRDMTDAEVSAFLWERWKPRTSRNPEDLARQYEYEKVKRQRAREARANKARVALHVPAGTGRVNSDDEPFPF